MAATNKDYRSAKPQSEAQIAPTDFTTAGVSRSSRIDGDPRDGQKIRPGVLPQPGLFSKMRATTRAGDREHMHVSSAGGGD
jgi:hypothetical protein